MINKYIVDNSERHYIKTDIAQAKLNDTVARNNLSNAGIFLITPFIIEVKEGDLYKNDSILENESLLSNFVYEFNKKEIFNINLETLQDLSVIFNYKRDQLIEIVDNKVTVMYNE